MHLFSVFPLPISIHRKGAEVAPVHVVKPAGRFLVIHYVVREGERQETAVLEAVQVAEPAHVLAQGEG